MKKLILLTCLLTACATAPKPGGISENEYEKIVREHTKSADKYQGLYQTFQASATLMTTEQQSATLQRKGDFLGWDANQQQKERDRAFQEMSNSTKVFLRFFSPENEYDDLHKPQSIWKVYLVHEGRQIEGKVKKLNDKFVELKMLYPHFDRFSSPYEVSFPVPTSAVEQSEVKIVLTSSLGSTEFTFEPKK
jgi:hypothetical protein